ncbi:MAG: PKD domain-containing protein [Flavobacteriales bacterium]|nr:PKD domain-containing protein [Flavobacteriales bacterium]
MAVGPNFVPITPWGGIRGLGRVNCVTFHPSNANTMFLGTPAGGIWKTTDGGQNWTSNTDFMPRLGVSDIAIHPTNHNTMFWATGDADGFDTFANGIFRSTDGGSTWTQTAFPTNVQTIARLLIQPNNANNMIAATSSGIYRSTNGGTSWTLTQTGNFSSMEFKPNSYNTIYAVTRNNGQFWRSTNNGVSWSQITSGIPSSGTRRGKIAVSPHNANYVYVIFCDQTGSFYGLYRSTNSGVSFSQRERCVTPSTATPNLLGWNANGTDYGGQGWYDLSLAVSRTNANDVWVGGVNIWQSTDGGASWTNRSLWSASGQTNYVHADIHELEFSHHNNTLFVCSDGGFGKRSGSTWEDLSEDLEITQFYSVGIAESIQDNIIGGAQDNGTLHHRNDYTSADNWTAKLGGDGMQCIIDPTNSNIMYGASQNGSISRSQNGGTSWTDISPDNGGAWETPYEISPSLSNPQRMVAGYDQLYLSTNGGTSWTALGSTSGLLNGSNAQEIELTNNNNIFYFSFNDKLFRTTNGGSAWTDISSGLATQATITDIHSSPNNANHIWVTFGGTWNPSNKVYHSTDGGNNWTNITYNLPNVSVNCVTVDVDNNRTFVGTDLGVYRRNGIATSWTNYNLNSLPNVIVKDLEINDTNHFLYAGTFGRGVWKISIAENIAPTAEFSANPTEICANQSIQFTDESVGGPTSWSWNFGDGTTNSTLQNPTHTYTSSGTYTVILIVTNSSDSHARIRTNYITVHPASSTQTLNVTACEEYVYTGGATPVTYTASGTYTIVSNGGCLTTTLNLTIEDPPQPTYTSISACGSYTWSENGQTYTSSGFYEYVEPPTTTGGCSSGHTLNLNIIPHITENVTACDSYTVGGVNRTSSGTYYETSTNPTCTTKTVNLTINQTPATIVQNITQCDSYTWPVNGETYTQSGTYHYTEVGGASNGCDQKYTLNLTINSAFDINNLVPISACDSYTWPINGETYTQSGVYSTVLTDANGC